MGPTAFVLATCLVAGPAPSEAAGRTADARKLYNQGLYELAIKAASEARVGRRCGRRGQPDRRARASRTVPPDTRRAQPHRGAGRAARRRRDPPGPGRKRRVHAGPRPVAVSGGQVPRRRRVVRLGLGQRRPSGPGGARSRARLVGDGHRPAGAGRSRRIARRSTSASSTGWKAELRVQPGSSAAGYWLAAAARSLGDTERAWHAALAGYVRASVAADRGVALRADLDRLVSTAVIPERARQHEPDLAKSSRPSTR